MSKNPYIDDPEHYCSGGASKLSGKNFTGLMEVMKFAYHFITKADLEKVYKWMESIDLPYSLAPIDTIKYSYKKDISIRKYHFYGASGVEFSPAFTNQGLCYSWNSLDIMSMSNPSNFMQSVGKVFNISKRVIKDGSLRKVSLILDKHDSYSIDRSGNRGLFSIGLNGFDSDFDVTSSSPTSLPLGHKTIIKVTKKSVYISRSTYSFSAFQYRLKYSLLIFTVVSIISTCISRCKII